MAEHDEIKAQDQVAQAGKEYRKLGIAIAAYMLWLSRKRRIEVRDRRRLRARIERELGKTTLRAERIVRKAIESATREAARQIRDIYGRSGVSAEVLRQVQDEAVEIAMERLRNAAAVVASRAESRASRLVLNQVAMAVQAGDESAEIARAISRSAKSNVADLADEIRTNQFYLDQSGRKWRLNTYAELVVRTTAARSYNMTVQALAPVAGFDLVRIVPGGGCTEECADVAGRVFSLSGRTPGVDALPGIPPYHPNCVHVMEPVAAAAAAR